MSRLVEFHQNQVPLLRRVLSGLDLGLSWGTWRWLKRSKELWSHNVWSPIGLDSPPSVELAWEEDLPKMLIINSVV